MSQIVGADAKALFKEKFGKLNFRYKWLAIPAVLLLGPVSYFIAYSLFGATLALGAAALLGATWLTIVNIWPKWAMQLANYKLRELKAEAERHPIETLQNQQAKLEQGLKEQANKITELDTGVEDYRTFLTNEATENPEAAMAGIPTLRNMERLLVFRRRKWADARRRLDERAAKIKSADAKYRVALRAQALAKTAGENEQTVLDKILEEIAFGAVDSTVNTSMAELRTAVMLENLPDDEVIEMDAPLQITNQVDRQEIMRALMAPAQVKEVRQAIRLPNTRDALQEITYINQ